MEAEFETQDGRAAPPASAEPTPTTGPASAAAPAIPAPAIPAAPAVGELAGRIEIPAIGVDFFFLEGVDLDTLRDGPGHYEGTPLPGQPGNAAIAGHRTTYLHPFLDIDRLGPGDEIHVTYPGGTEFTYEYRTTEIVRPDRVDVLHDMGDDRLTLTACHPRYSARERIVVTARLVDPPAPAPAPVTDEPTPAGVAGATDEAALGNDLDGRRGPATPAVLWGIGAALVALAAAVVGRRWRRWPTYVLAAPLFAFALYGFFERFYALLPSGF